MSQIIYGLIFPFGFVASVFILGASLLVWAVWGRYLPRVIYGSLGMLALVIYVFWLSNYLSAILCFSPGPGCGARVFTPMASAVATAHILLIYSLVASIVALFRRSLGRPVKKLVFTIGIVVLMSVAVLVIDSLVPFEYSSARAFDNYSLNIPTTPVVLP